jgi:hypothetical protein
LFQKYGEGEQSPKNLAVNANHGTMKESTNHFAGAEVYNPATGAAQSI